MAARRRDSAASLPSGLIAPGMQDVVALRPLRPADHGLVRSWLRDPGVQRWWGTIAAAEAAVAMALDSDAALCRMISLAGEPIGYAQAMDAAGLGEPLPASLPAGTYDCDLFIGVETHRGKGFGQRALAMIADEVFATTLAVACSVVVSIRNETAARAYENAGFGWREIWHDPVDGPSWVMLRERPRLPR